MGVGTGTAEGAGNNVALSEEEVRQITRLSEQDEMQVDGDDIDAIMEAEQIEEYQHNIELATE